MGVDARCEATAARAGRARSTRTVTGVMPAASGEPMNGEASRLGDPAYAPAGACARDPAFEDWDLGRGRYGRSRSSHGQGSAKLARMDGWGDAAGLGKSAPCSARRHGRGRSSRWWSWRRCLPGLYALNWWNLTPPGPWWGLPWPGGRSMAGSSTRPRPPSSLRPAMEARAFRVVALQPPLYAWLEAIGLTLGFGPQRRRRRSCPATSPAALVVLLMYWHGQLWRGLRRRPGRRDPDRLQPSSA